jgi:AcrR family transcriptional regulator
MTPRPKKTQQRTNFTDSIKEAAWKQIAAHGAPALSLRAIARELHITAPAIYNYFPDRDALVTALITDAFLSLGNAQIEAIQDLPAGDLPARLVALGLSYRQWAVSYSQRYQLIFGTPIPSYRAPEDITLPAAAWALSPLVSVLQSLHQAGRLRLDQQAPMTPALAAMLSAWSQFAGGASAEVFYMALIVWSRVHGLVMLEIGGQMPSFFTDPGEVFRREIAGITIQYLIA